MFIPNPSVLPSQSPSCCDPTQLQGSGRRQSLPRILADTDPCQARDCTQNQEKKKKSRFGVITPCLQTIATAIGFRLEAERFCLIPVSYNHQFSQCTCRGQTVPCTAEAGQGTGSAKRRQSRSSGEHSIIPPALGEPPVTPMSPVLQRALLQL